MIRQVKARIQVFRCCGLRDTCCNLQHRNYYEDFTEPNKLTSESCVPTSCHQKFYIHCWCDLPCSSWRREERWLQKVELQRLTPCSLSCLFQEWWINLYRALPEWREAGGYFLPAVTLLDPPIQSRNEKDACIYHRYVELTKCDVPAACCLPVCVFFFAMPKTVQALPPNLPMDITPYVMVLNTRLLFRMGNISELLSGCYLPVKFRVQSVNILTTLYSKQ